MAKVVYFTRSRLSSDPPQTGRQTASPSAKTSPLSQIPASPPSANAGPSSPTQVNGSGSRFHSRQSSASGAGGHPKSPSTDSLSTSTSSSHLSHPTPNGTLTPTAILSERHHHPPYIGSAVNAMRSSLLKRRSLPAALPGGRLNFIKFETADIDSCIAFLQDLIESSARANKVTIKEMRRGVKLMATGGGAHLFYEQFEKALGVEVKREDEMGCLITGLNFITLIPDEVFWYSDELVSALHSPLPHSSERRADPSSVRSSAFAPAPPRVSPEPLPRPSPDPPLYAPMFDSNPTPKLPCLLVNIGSGVSIIKVDDYGKFERVSGTSLGGGTLWGLLSLLTDANSFDEMLELSERGDNGAVDLLVSDVYGNSNALNAFGLKSSTIASSFGKVFRKGNQVKSGGAAGRKKRFRPEDICKSLLYAVSNNIGQIAHMTAEKYDLDRIYFGGCFIRGHQATISTLSYAIRFWSKGTKRAFFLRHEGYLGAIGAWIKHLDDPPTVMGDHRVQQSYTIGASSPAIGSPLRKQSPPAPATDGNSSDTSEIPSIPRSVPTATVPPSSMGSSAPLPAFLPAKTMKSSGLLTNPIAEIVESAYQSHRKELVEMGATDAALQSQQRCPEALAEASGVISGHELSADSGSAQPPRQESTNATENGTDLLSILHSLQNGHKSILAPLVQASGSRVVNSDRLRTARGAEVGEKEEEGELDNEPISALLETGDVEGAHSMRELLRKLDGADYATDGLEHKLDVLLGRLDTMLQSGEAATALSSAAGR